MIEMSDSEINVDRLMHQIREAVARQNQSGGQNDSESLSVFSLTDKTDSNSQGGSPSLNLQPQFHSRRDDQYHIDDFLKYHGEEFLRTAYRALLKREPDPSGWTQYLNSLSSGRFNKVDILASLRYSPEGERAQVKVAGLAWPATIRRLERLPIIGYLLEMAIAAGRLPRLHRHLRRSEFYLLARQQQIVDHDDQFHKQLAEALTQVSAKTLAGTETAANQQLLIESLLQQQKDLAARQIEFNNLMEAGLIDARQHVDERTAALKQQLDEQKENYLRQYQELAQQTAEQMQRLLHHQQEVSEQKELLRQHQQLSQQAAEQTQEQLRQQRERTQKIAEQLTQQVAQQIERLLRGQQLAQTEIVMQERRLTSLLEEARKRSPDALDQPILELIATEEDHLLDPLYASFEDQFRGEREEIKNRLRVYLPILKGANVLRDVLDIGSGRGEWLEILKHEGVRARGVDRNRVFIEQCRQSGLEVVEADALAYLRSLPDRSLDAATSFHLVEHLPFETLIKLLDEIVRTLRSGGLLILETPNPENFMVGSYSFYADPTHRNPIPSATLQFLLESRGLGRIEVMKLRPWDAAKIDGNTEIIKRFNEYFYCAPDYGIIGWKV
jgi:O-antigen chain-terminating methyltransferase